MSIGRCHNSRKFYDSKLEYFMQGGCFMKGRFYISDCELRVEAGYMVEQVYNGETYSMEFVSQKYFEEFCSAAGIVPLEEDVVKT